jgi:uncharacterized repeat protein (TIGR01451 family)
MRGGGGEHRTSKRVAGLFLRAPGALVVALVFVLVPLSTPASAFHTRPAVVLQDPNPVVVVGQEITWFITVTNPFGVPLTHVTVSDGTVFPKCTHDFSGRFPAHASEAYVCTYVPTAPGTLSNMVTVTYGARHTAGIPSSLVSVTVAAYSPSVATALTPPGPVLAGTPVSDQATLSGVSSTAGGTVSYAVFSDSTCTDQVASLGTQTVSDGDVPPSVGWTSIAGSYWFQATYSGDASNTGPVSSPCSSEPLTVEAPGIAVTDLPAGQTIASGGTANWTIQIQNAGNVALSDVTVADPVAPDCVTTFAGTLPPGASEPGFGCSRAGVTAGFTNTATVTGTPPVGPDVSSSASAVVTIEGPGITITKLPATQTILSGGTATWTIGVMNSGTATLSNVSVSDPVAPNCAATFAGTLGPGAGETGYSCSLTGRTATFTNTATATGTPPSGPDVTATATATVTVNPYTPSVATAVNPSGAVLVGTSVADQATLNGAGPTAGGTVSYAIYSDSDCSTLVKSLGTADVTDGTVGPSARWTPAAGDYWFQATYSGDDSDTGPVSSTCGSEPVTVEAPGVTLVKSASITSYAVAGIPVTFLYKVTDTGNTALYPVTVTDPMTALSAISCPQSLLGPTDTETCTATHTTTRADVRNGSINSTGSVTATPPIGPAVTATSAVTVPVSRTPGISLLKTASVTNYSSAGGTTVTYSYLVTNSGNVTLKPVVVTDPMPGLSAITCPGAKLAVRGSETCTATYTTTVADGKAGSLTNTGTATGTIPTGSDVTATSSVTIVAAVTVTVIGPGNAGFTTSPASASISLGGSDTDTGTFAPGGPPPGSETTAGVTPPTGSVAFYVCGPLLRATACTTSGTALGTVAVVDSGSTATVTSPTFVPSSTGIYCFLAVYSGDVMYGGAADSAVPTECFTVGPGTVGLTTSPSGSIALGGTETDTAVVTGTGTTTPTGSVTYYVTTAAGVVDLGSPNLATTGPDVASSTSPAYMSPATGTYCFLALYSGDSNYGGASDSAIPGECFTVTHPHVGP